MWIPSLGKHSAVLLSSMRELLASINAVLTGLAVSSLALPGGFLGMGNQSFQSGDALT